MVMFSSRRLASARAIFLVDAMLRIFVVEFDFKDSDEKRVDRYKWEAEKSS